MLPIIANSSSVIPASFDHFIGGLSIDSVEDKCFVNESIDEMFMLMMVDVSINILPIADKNPPQLALSMM